MTNEELVKRIKTGIDVADNMLTLWQQNRSFIHSIAKRYQGKAEIEDLEQEGYLALYDAVNGYKPEYGYKFLTYAGQWINQRMVRYIQNNGTIRIPVHESEKLNEYRKMVDAFNSYLGRKPTQSEIAYNMGLTDKKVRVLEKAAQMGQIGSLDSYLTEDGSSTVGDMVPCDVDIEADVLDDIQQEQLQAVLWPLVDELPEEQRQVIRCRYQEGEQLRTIGERLGVNIDRVRTIENSALRNMRSSKNSHLLYSFLTDEAAYSMGVSGNGAERFGTTWTSSTERAAIVGVMGHF